MTEIFALTVVVEAVTVRMIFTVTAPRVVLGEFVPIPGTPVPGVSVTPARKIRTTVLIPKVSPAQMMVSTVTEMRPVTAVDPAGMQEAPVPMPPVLKEMISAPVIYPESPVKTVSSATAVTSACSGCVSIPGIPVLPWVCTVMTW